MSTTTSSTITTDDRSPQDQLRAAVAALDAEVGKGGWDSASRREAALIAGLKAYAAVYGRSLFGIHAIDGNGELAFNIAHPTAPPRREPSCGAWGLHIGTDLGRIPTRTGAAPAQYPQLPESGWTRLNHFAAEKLLKLVVADMESGRRPAMDALVDAVDALDGNFGKAWAEEDGGATVSATLRFRYPTLDEHGKIRDAHVPVKASVDTVEIDGQRHELGSVDALKDALLESLAEQGWTPEPPAQPPSSRMAGPAA